MGAPKITNYSANINGIAVKRKPLANTQRGSQKGGGVHKTKLLQTRQQTLIGSRRLFGNLHGIIWVKYNFK